VERVRLDAEPLEIRDGLQRSIADVLNAIAVIERQTRRTTDDERP
jgi:hypothetical protein